MNERIRELAKQARRETYDHFSDETFDWDVWHTVFQQKFAELIVQECCDVLQNEDIRYGGYGYNLGFLHKKIKEHFGVEQ